MLPDQSGAHPHEMVSAGKNGTVYLVDRDNMGHFHSAGDQIVQSLVNIFPNNLGHRGQELQLARLLERLRLLRSGRGPGTGLQTH